MKYLFLPILVLAILVSCKKDNPKKVIDNRQFKMGFTTWPYGPTLANVNDSYEFIKNNGDVYGEHMDHKVPWNAWLNGTELPTEFTDLVKDKVNRKPANAELLLSISFLNGGRSDIMEDFDGSKPTFDGQNDSALVEAYFKHVSYLVDELGPTYLVYSIESNELFVNNPSLWPAFRTVMENVGAKLKSKYPNLSMAESLTLHSWYKSSTDADYLAEVEKIANEGTFAAISFYPFFKQLHTKNEFQDAFDFLHSKVNIPIAFAETNHLAEDLVVNGLSLNITSDENEQEAYLEALLLNAHEKNYQFIIWWAHRDYDALWETFPAEIKDLGQLWRDTGLLDEDGKERKSMKLWENIFAK